jgi:hypothetical protein
MRRTGPAKLAALVVLSVLVGLNLILPAGAHVTKRVPHLLKHLDPRYLNVDEMAANANLLDGQDSSAFLGANAKAADTEQLDGQDSSAFLGANARAADADLLDGLNSTAFMAGPGKVIEEVVALPPGSSGGVMLEEGLFNIQYQCPDVLSDNGTVGLLNVTFGTVNLFTDNGSTNPTYQQVPASNFAPTAAAATGEFITFQVHAPNVGIATINVMSVHRASDCHVQAQAVISS